MSGDMKRGPRPANALEAAASARKFTRIEHIAELRRSLAWDRETSAKLQAEWGIARKSMEGLAAEAGRIVAREVLDRDDVSADVGSRLRLITRHGGDRDAVQAGKVWAQLAGVMAPTQHLHADVAPVLLSDEWQRVSSAVMVALQPFPEAMAAVVAALEGLSGPRE